VAGHLDELAAPLLVQLRDRESNELAVIGRVEAEVGLQKHTDTSIAELDTLLKGKEAEILEV